ncbi:MAG: hypothetical protein ACKE51_02685 [Methylococcaceae bacterium]
MWFVSTCFFAFMLAHLLADVFFPFREYLYHFTIFLISFGLWGTIYCELDAKHHHILSNKAAFEMQGRFLGFEFLFIMILLFTINH